jgi:Tol biopolymer transport system component
MDFSPDGRSIAYDTIADEATGERSVYLLDAAGGSERRLIGQSGNYLFPLWTPGGERVVFASDRNSTMDLMAVDAATGRLQLLRADLGRILLLGMTREGELFYGSRSGASDVFVSRLPDLARSATRATQRFPNLNSAPAWSADGGKLAYLSRRGSENFGQEARVIVVRDFEKDREYEVVPRLSHIERVRWSPDASKLLASGSDGRGRSGLFLVDPETSAVKPLHAEADAPFRGYDAVWSKDGRSIYYLQGAELRARTLSPAAEKVLFRGDKLRALATNGEWLAFGSGDRSVVLLPAAGGAPRTLAFDGAAELEWGRQLLAGRGAEIWALPLDGSPPRKLDTPGNRAPGFSPHPDGQRLALTAGQEKAEVWAIRVTPP